GATFDESLEGLIRVSVVATGIDSAAAAAAASGESNQTSATAVPRAVTGVGARVEPKAAPAQAPAAAATPAGQAPIAANQRQQPAQVQASVFAEAKRDMQAFEETAKPQETRAAQTPEGEAFKPTSGLFSAPPQSMPARPTTAQAPASPAPEATQPRMPRVEDFPPMVQAEVNAQARQPAASAMPQEDERGPLGLLKRLATGFSKAEDEGAPRTAPRATPLPTMQPQPRRELSDDASLYAPRRGQLDDNGRTAPQPLDQDEDQMEIPAFLRRQAR
ncbi:MAG: cell division protein FtsZ, partial [Pseudomonadota bacterium]